MTLAASTINVGGTSSVTGGSSTGLLYRGGDINQGKYILDDGSEFLAITKVNFSVLEPKVNSGAPNGYTQGRNFLSYIEPLALDNGNLTHNSFRGEFAFDVETTDAEKDAMIENVVQLIYGSALREFYQSQTLS